MKCPCCGGDMARPSDPAEYGRALALSRGERVIFERLSRTFGEWVPPETLIVAMYSGASDGGPLSAAMAVSSIVKALRTKLEPTDLVIETTRGRGNGARRLVWKPHAVNVKQMATSPESGRNALEVAA